ncbi:MAG: hypothetical protein NZZ41_02150 [Candidatus Dojkabacteria bacterium]|nr:hypothetical protein [Candidatus Dojkabacteria bacterium]
MKEIFLVVFLYGLFSSPVDNVKSYSTSKTYLYGLYNSLELCEADRVVVDSFYKNEQNIKNSLTTKTKEDKHKILTFYSFCLEN